MSGLSPFMNLWQDEHRIFHQPQLQVSYMPTCNTMSDISVAQAIAVMDINGHAVNRDYFTRIIVATNCMVHGVGKLFG